MSAHRDRYVFSAEWEHERARLGGLAALCDPSTLRHLTALGVGPGWRCLEIGGGAGSVARWLAAAIGPAGRLVVTDLDTRAPAACCCSRTSCSAAPPRRAWRRR